MNVRLSIIVLPLALLIGCKDGAGDDRRTASGEVLEGTISDDMLPLDMVQSQPPLMKSQAKKAVVAEATGEDAPAGIPEAAPAEVPAPATD